MELVKFLENLHKKPALFKFLVSIAIPYQINNEFKYNKDLTLYCIKLYSDTLNRRKASIWHNAFFPTEIFYAMDISPFTLEISSSILAKFKLSNKLISRAEMSGLTRELCSFQKCVAGAFSSNLIPKPQMIATSSEICDSARKMGEVFSGEFSIPHFYLDIPFSINQSSIDYIKEQLEDFIKWLEINTGKKLLKDRLIQSVKYSNQLRQNLLKIMDIRCKYPGIMGQKPVFGLFNFTLSSGSYEGVKISEKLYQELLYKSGYYNIPKNQIKFLWLHFTPFYKERFTEVLKKNPSLSVVFEELNNIYWEELLPEDPLEGIARKILSSPFQGSVENRIEKIKYLVNIFDIKGVIHFSQLGCRQCNGGVTLIKETLKEKDITFLELSGDCIDSRNYSEGQLKTRLEAFMELFD